MTRRRSTPVAAPVSFTLNGQTVVAAAGETILEAADRVGVEIPRLCHMAGLRPDGNCRTCMVEIKGERVLAPSCCRYPSDGMDVTSNSARALVSQKMSIELLLSDVPERVYTLNSELDTWDEALLNDLTRVMTDASICGLGQAAMNPVKQVLKHFRQDLS